MLIAFILERTILGKFLKTYEEYLENAFVEDGEYCFKVDEYTFWLSGG